MTISVATPVIARPVRWSYAIAIRTAIRTIGVIVESQTIRGSRAPAIVAMRIAPVTSRVIQPIRAGLERIRGE